MDKRTLFYWRYLTTVNFVLRMRASISRKMKSDNLNFKSNEVRIFTGLEKNTRTAERKLYSSSRIVIELLQM